MSHLVNKILTISAIVQSYVHSTGVKVYKNDTILHW